MHLHLVGGFLGSGKTTAIIQASQSLLQRGVRVGVVTNDQGKYLVDTAFMRAMTMPTVEVTGGCFCCNYEDLEEQLQNLTDATQPDVIFAESVGSCADLVATVVKPLQAYQHHTLKPSSLSVFGDSRLLYRRLNNQPMPFSENVTYIFDKQIEEANLLIINKVDLLRPHQKAEILTLAQARYPDKRIYTQNSLDVESVAGWLDILQENLPLPEASLEIDYARYGQGEAELAWLDEKITLSGPVDGLQEAVPKLIDKIVKAIRENNLPIGHVKFFVQSGESEVKLSYPTLEEPILPVSKLNVSSSPVILLINARIETQAERLQDLIGQLVTETVQKHQLQAQIDLDAFHPAMPEPIHRFS